MLAIVTDLINPDRVRGRSLVVPRWWLDAARSAAEASGLGLVELAAKLSAKVGRSEPWTHGTISRFLAGKGVTDQLAEAMILFFDLPRPVYYPRDLPEALLFRAAEAKRDKRLADADAVAERMEREKRQTEAVPSTHAVTRGRVLDRGVSSPRRG
jgi:hypothetical protein